MSSSSSSYVASASSSGSGPWMDPADVVRERDRFATEFGARAEHYSESSKDAFSQLKSLHFWRTKMYGMLPYSHNAGHIVEASFRFSRLGHLFPDKKKVSQFVRHFRSDRQLVLSTLSIDELQGVLESYAAAFDYLFLFGTLTDPIRSTGGRLGQPWAMGPNRRINIVVDRESDNDLYGLFRIPEDTIYIYMKADRRGDLPLDKVVWTLSHELVHAYLCILSVADSYSERYRDVEFNEGHGLQFYQQWRQMMTVLHLLVPDSQELQELTAEVEEEHNDTQVSLSSFRVQPDAIKSPFWGLVWLVLWIITMTCLIWDYAYETSNNDAGIVPWMEDIVTNRLFPWIYSCIRRRYKRQFRATIPRSRDDTRPDRDL
ncbi:hypothetical protein AB5N19_04335 [Seiridium cardinale]